MFDKEQKIKIMEEIKKNNPELTEEEVFINDPKYGECLSFVARSILNPSFFEKLNS